VVGIGTERGRGNGYVPCYQNRWISSVVIRFMFDDGVVSLSCSV
jgi:hypothetical protein